MKKILFMTFLILLLLCACEIKENADAPETTAETTETTAETTETTPAILPNITEMTTEATTETTTAAETTAAVSTQTPAPSFIASSTLDGYTHFTDGEPLIESIDGITYINGVLIVNKSYPLPQSYAPGGLESNAETAFYEMQSAASADGIKIRVLSGYRSYATQKYGYDGYVARDGQELADTYSARAGYSEHQSGLAMDINVCENWFADSDEGKWLAAHCAEYGFIIRYPKGKEEQTGFMYEPWHIRYLGKDLAAAVTDSGLCLEEYLKINSQYAE